MHVNELEIPVHAMVSLTTIALKAPPNQFIPY